MKKISFLGKTQKIHPSWNDFLTREFTSQLKIAEADLDLQDPTLINPERSKILRFLEFDLTNLRCIILGQDPYHQPGAATGRAFEVNGFTDWNQSIDQRGLIVILKALYLIDHPDLRPLKDIRNMINSGSFKILPPDLLFDHWQSQGVLLLNTSLSCEVNKPGSHRKIWSKVSEMIINHLSKLKALWLLWGADARKAASQVDDDIKRVCDHPAPNRFQKSNFLEENHFKQTSQEFDWTGKSA